MRGGEKASTSKLNGEEGLGTGRVSEGTPEKTREGGKLQRVRIVVDRKEGVGVAGAKTVGDFGTL